MNVTYVNPLTYSRFDYCITIVLAIEYNSNNYVEHVGCCTGNDFQRTGIQDISSPIS